MGNYILIRNKINISARRGWKHFAVIYLTGFDNAVKSKVDNIIEIRNTYLRTSHDVVGLTYEHRLNLISV